MVCLRSTNAESTERLFSQIKHISLRATNRKPDNVLTTVLLSMQAKEETGTLTSLRKNSTMVTEVATTIQWNNHFERLSEVTHVKPLTTHQSVLTYLQQGEWETVGDKYQFLDSPSTQLHTFRNTTIKSTWDKSKAACKAAWNGILASKTILPTPYIRLFKDDQYIGRRSFPADSQTVEPTASDPTPTRPTTPPQGITPTSSR